MDILEASGALDLGSNPSGDVLYAMQYDFIILSSNEKWVISQNCELTGVNMSNKLVIIILLTMVLVLTAVDVYANPSIKQAFTTQYDVEGTKLDTCTTCMSSTSTPVSWNPFGIALRNDPDFNRNNPAQALENIEQLDSDGDGFTNIDEIHNSTAPGDSDNSPATPSGTQTPMSTPAEENTLNTMFNVLATLAAVVMVSIVVRKKNVEG